MFNVLDSLLKEKGVTAYYVCKEAKIEPASFSRWKSGKESPSTESLVRLSDFFGVSVDYLLGRTTRRKPYRS